MKVHFENPMVGLSFRNDGVSIATERSDRIIAERGDEEFNVHHSEIVTVGIFGIKEVCRIWCKESLKEVDHD